MVKGRNGRPGTTAKTSMMKATVARAAGWRPICATMSLSMAPVVPPRASRRPEAMEMMTAGICETRPSPTVRMA